MAELTTEKRNDLPESSFAIPPDRYPIDTENRARNALARVAQFGTDAEQAQVRAAVHRKFPNIGREHDASVAATPGK